jgi:hypothetical protein
MEKYPEKPIIMMLKERRRGIGLREMAGGVPVC